jgi:segregation and condensation protein B
MSAEDLGVALQRPVDEITETVEALQSDYATAGRGFTIRRESGGWRFVTSADCSELVSRYIKDGQSARLSQAALETLAVVAYRQPVSRTRVSAIRAVNVDGVMKTLVTRGLVTEVGHDAESGAVLYATTEYFLQRLGISSLDELPPVADYLPDLSDLDSPELTGEF